MRPATPQADFRWQSRGQLLEPQLVEKFRQDPFARSLGMELEEVRPGYARVSMPVKSDMVNFHGIIHGGAIFSLADYAFGVASNSHGRTAVALNVNITYLATAPVGARLIAEAEVERLGGRTALYHMMVRDDAGQQIASCHGVVYRKDESIL